MVCQTLYTEDSASESGHFESCLCSVSGSVCSRVSTEEIGLFCNWEAALVGQKMSVEAVGWRYFV